MLAQKWWTVKGTSFEETLEDDEDGNDDEDDNTDRASFMISKWWVQIYIIPKYWPEMFPETLKSLGVM